MANFLEYVQSLNPVILSIPKTGDIFNSYDAYQRTVSVTGTLDWQRPTMKGFGIIPVGTSFYRIAHGAEQQQTKAITLFVFSSKGFIDPGVNGYQYLISKDDAVGLAWAFYIRVDGGTNRTYVTVNGAFSQVSNVDWNGKRSLAVSMEDVTAVDFYQDGIPTGTTAGLDISTQPAADVYVGCKYNSTFPLLSPLDLACVFPSILTSEQISILHNSFDEMIVGYEPRKTYFIPPQDMQDAVVYIGTKPNASSLCRDLSGSDNHATITDNITFRYSNLGVIYKTNGKGNGLMRIASSASWQDNNYNVFSMGLCINSTGEGGSGRMLEKHTGPSAYFSFFAIAGPTGVITQTYSDGAAQWSFPIPFGYYLYFQLWFHRSDPTVLPRVFINGEEVTVSVLIARAGVVVSDSGSDIVFGNRPSLDRESDIEWDDFKLHITNLSSTNLTEEYVVYATRHLVDLSSRFEHSVTLSAVSSPKNVGPWSLLSGSANWTDDGTDRYIQRATDCAFLQPSEFAYGAWYFKAIHSTGNNVIQFIASQRSAYNTAGQQGYNLLLNSTGETLTLNRQNGAVSTSIDTSVGALTEGVTYEFFITRKLTDGTFDVYVRGGIYTTWNKLLNGTDNTYTSSKFFVGDLTANGTLINPIIYPYGDSLIPFNIDFPTT